MAAMEQRRGLIDTTASTNQPQQQGTRTNAPAGNMTLKLPNHSQPQHGRQPVLSHTMKKNYDTYIPGGEMASRGRWLGNYFYYDAYGRESGEKAWTWRNHRTNSYGKRI